MRASYAEADERIAAAHKALHTKEDALERDRQEFLAYRVSIIAQKDQLVASLQDDVLRLRGDLDHSSSTITEKDNFITVLNTEISRLRKAVGSALPTIVEKDTLLDQTVNELSLERKTSLRFAAVQSQVRRTYSFNYSIVNQSIA